MNTSAHDDERSLAAALRALAEDGGEAGASPYVGSRLRDEVRSIARRRRRTRAMNTVLAAALCVVVGGLVWQVAEHRVPFGAATLPAGTPPLIAEEFLPLTYSTVPMTRGEIVRLEVPTLALEAFGIEPGDSQNGSRPGTVLADVLVGDDGLARGVRFVRP